MATRIDGDTVHVDTVFTTITQTTITTAGNVTYTAAQMLGGLISRDGNGANRSDTLPTAALLVSAMQAMNSAVVAGSSFRCFISEIASPAREITLLPGTGMTIVGNDTIKKNKAVQIIVIITDATPSSEAVTISIIGNSEVA